MDLQQQVSGETQTKTNHPSKPQGSGKSAKRITKAKKENKKTLSKTTVNASTEGDKMNNTVLNNEKGSKNTKNHDEKKNNKRKKTRFFETYISKVLKTMSASNGITANAKQQLNSAVCIISKQISHIVNVLTFIAKKKTSSEKEVINAVRLIFPANLANGAINEGEKSISKFAEEEDKHSSRQEKAGIVFPPSIAEKFLRNFGFSKIMITKTAPVFLASVLEYLVTVILNLATKRAVEHRRVRITIRDLELAVREDADLNSLWDKCNLNFIGGGVVPNIHSSLLAKRPRKKKKVGESETVTDKNKKNHRFRPGTVSLREIKRFQKASNCLTFAKYPFERFVRGLVMQLNETMKISKDVFVVLQYYIEQFVVDFLRDANKTAIHAGRVKLMPTDLTFVCELRRYEPLNMSLVQTVSSIPVKVKKTKPKKSANVEEKTTEEQEQTVEETEENDENEEEDVQDEEQENEEGEEDEGVDEEQENEEDELSEELLDDE